MAYPRFPGRGRAGALQRALQSPTCGGEHAFENFRTLLEAVTRHPMTGLYLSHLKNQKEDPVRHRIPDQNFAREVMQLFTIGLIELNQDGTPRPVGGEPVETYTDADIIGLSQVFKGFSWAGPE
ncbi:MAG: DUF1800 family protein [Pseudomonadales bacterium]